MLSLNELRTDLADGDPAPELARAQARVDALCGDERVVAHRFTHPGVGDGSMYGMSYLTKANIAVTGQPLDCSSAILQGYRSPYEATATRKLREAGFTCLGATNMDEFAMGSSGETSIRGAPEHPWLAGRVCGGSSSGSAAAVARGAVPFALGSDTGGSVRQPAALCGLVGLKPTWGRVSRYGLVAHASSLDTIGVLAPTAFDAGLVCRFLEGADARDATVADWPRLPMPVTPRRIVAPRLTDGSVSPVVAENLQTVLELLEPVADIEHVEIPSLPDALGAYVVLAAAEAASNLARYDGSIYGARVEAGTYADSVSNTRNRGFGAEVKLRILLGTEVLRKGHTANAIARARAVVDRLRREFDAVVPPEAVCVLPTVPEPAFETGSRVHDPLAMRAADRFTVVASLLGLPGVSVPSGEDDTGAPLAVQGLAHRGRDDLALGLAAAVEDVCRIRKLQTETWYPRITGAPS